jgi:hypothetical protein
MIETIIRFEAWGFLGAAAAIIVLQGVTGRINLKGMLSSNRNGSLSPVRIQLLFTTLGFAGWYLTQVRLAIWAHSLELPPIPPDMLIVLTASQATYLVGKGADQFNLLGLLRRI